MAPADNSSERYISLNEVAEKCTDLVKKWSYITDKKKIESTNLEDELIRRAQQQQLYLYCFMPISRTMGKRWCFIWSDYLNQFLNSYASVECNLFLVSRMDRIYFDRLVDSHPRLMEIRRSELYLDLD